MQVEWLSVPIYRVGLNSVIIRDESYGKKKIRGRGKKRGVGREGGREDVWRRLRAREGKVIERFPFKFSAFFILRSASRS